MRGGIARDVGFGVAMGAGLGAAYGAAVGGMATAVAAGVAVGAIGGWAGPHFLRGFREARDQRGVDLNMQHRAEQELAEEELEDAEWRRRLDHDLDEQIERWRQEDA